MATYGGGLYGGAGSSGAAASAGVAFSEIGMAAYRIAGITRAARVGPNQDLWDECIPAYNRMVGSWNCERPKIFTIRLDTVSCPQTKICTIGSGGDFDIPRPSGIQNGVIVLADGSRQKPMAQLDAEDWARITVQDVPNSIPRAFYYDNAVDPVTGLARVYLYEQAQGGLQVDWYTFHQLSTVTSKDDQIAFPPEYEEAITFGLALRLAALNPLIANMSEDAKRIGRKALAALEAKNSKPPRMTSDFPGTGHVTGATDWWRTGGF